MAQFIAPPCSSHAPVKLLMVPLGATSHSAAATYTCALLSANVNEVPLCELSFPSPLNCVPQLPVRDGVMTFEYLLEPPVLTGSPASDYDNAEAFYPSRALLRAYVAVCDGSAHDRAMGGSAELVSLIRSFFSDAARLQGEMGPQIWPEPIVRVFVFHPSEAQMEASAILGTRVHFITHALDGGVGSEGAVMHLKVALSHVASDVLRALDAECSALTRMAEDPGAISVTPPDASNAALAGLPATLAGKRSGGVEVGLFAGLGSFSLALGSVKKRLAGRLHKRRADTLLMCGSPLDASDAIDRAQRALKATSDSLFLGLCEETRAACAVARYAAENGLPCNAVPALSDAATSLREAVLHFDTAAALPELASMSDVLAQLCTAARLRLIRYLSVAPPLRAIDAVCEVAAVGEDGLLAWWNGSRSARGQDLLAPDFLHDDTILRAACEAGRAGTLVQRAVAAAVAAQMTSPNAAAAPPASAASILTQESGIGSLLSGRAGAAGTTVMTPSGSIELKGFTYTDVLDYLAAASARCRDVKTPICLARLLLALAETYELVGLTKKADAASWRACRVLRQLQPLIPVDAFATPPASARAGRESRQPRRSAGCIYAAVGADRGVTVDAACAPRVCGSMPAWPYPWLAPTAPAVEASAFFPAYRFAPSMIAALLSLSCAARDASTRGYLVGRPVGAVAAPDRGRLRADVASSARILMPSTSLLDWLPVVATDFWQCGEVHLTLAAVSLCVASDVATQSDALLHMPASTAFLRDAEPCFQLVRHTPLSTSPCTISAVEGDAEPTTQPAVHHTRTASTATGAPTSPSTTSLSLSLMKLRNRRFLCAAAASSVRCGSPLMIVRAWLLGGAWSSTMSRLDALLFLKMLCASAVSGDAMAAHCDAHTRWDVAASYDTAAATTPQTGTHTSLPESSAHCIMDVLLADACCAAITCINMTRDVAGPSSTAPRRSDAQADEIMDMGADAAAVPTVGGVDRSPVAADDAISIDDVDTHARTIAWHPYALMHQLAAYIGASGEGLACRSGERTSAQRLHLIVRHAAPSAASSGAGSVTHVLRHVVAAPVASRAPQLQRLAFCVRATEASDVCILALTPARTGPLASGHMDVCAPLHMVVAERAVAPRSIRDTVHARTEVNSSPVSDVIHARASGTITAGKKLMITATLYNPAGIAVEGTLMLELRLRFNGSMNDELVHASPAHFALLPHAAAAVDVAVPQAELALPLLVSIARVSIQVGALCEAFLVQVRERMQDAACAADADVSILPEREARTDNFVQNSEERVVHPVMTATPLHGAVVVTDAWRPPAAAVVIDVPGFVPLQGSVTVATPLPHAVAIYGTSWL